MSDQHKTTPDPALHAALLDFYRTVLAEWGNSTAQAAKRSADASDRVHRLLCPDAVNAGR